MNRRSFMTHGLSLAMVERFGSAGATIHGTEVLPVKTTEQTSTSAINPQGIRVAGIKMIPVVGGRYKVWTKQIGAGPIKVLLLHGGPGASHEYLEAMESFLPSAGIEMYYYDQLGCGYSDRPDDPSLWNLDRYVEEVEEVRRGLQLDHFVLYGHSWGGMLALEYALRNQQHLNGLVISNMAAGITAYSRRLSSLKKEMLSPELQAKLKALEAAHAYDSNEYQSIVMDDLYPQMLCRLKPWPEPVERTFKGLNRVVYEEMQGKSEFQITGNIAGWERWDRLQEIRVRALAIGSKFDEMDPSDMKTMATHMKNGTYAYCPNGSHFCMWDDQASYFHQLLKWLRETR